MADEPVTFKKRKRRDPKNMKKKTLDEAPPEPKPEEPLPEKDEEEPKNSDDDEDEEDGMSEQIGKKPEKKSKKENPFITSTKKKIRELESVTHAYKSDRSTAPKNDKGISIEVEKIVRDQSKPKWQGVQTAPANVRIISRFDYQPDLCKDYNETGYCGYGDSCKFMHDRGDYKSGWQLEKEWEAEQEKKRRCMMGEDVSDEENFEIPDDEDGDLPFACLICREDFDNPVVTQCSHYFCEKCAVQNYVKNSRCFVCNEQTHGIFNTAKRLLPNIQKLKNKRAAEAEKMEEQIQRKGTGGAENDWTYTT